MRIEKRSMNWLPKPSAYSQVAMANAKRKAANESFLSGHASMADSFASIQANFAIETGNIASQAAAKRLGVKLK